MSSVNRSSGGTCGEFVLECPVPFPLFAWSALDLTLDSAGSRSIELEPAGAVPFVLGPCAAGFGPVDEYPNWNGKATIGWIGPIGISATLSRLLFSFVELSTDDIDPRRSQSFHEEMTGLTSTSLSLMSRLSSVDPRRFIGGSPISICGVMTNEDDALECELPGVLTSSSRSRFRLGPLANSVGDSTLAWRGDTYAGSTADVVGEGKRRGGNVAPRRAPGDVPSEREVGEVPPWASLLLSSADMLYCDRSNLGDVEGLVRAGYLSPLGCDGTDEPVYDVLRV